MSRFLHLAEREVKKIQSKHEEMNGTEDLSIFIDWGRDGEKNLKLLTIVKNVSKNTLKKLYRD